MSLTEQQIKTALAAAVDPNTGKDFVAGRAVKNIRIDGINCVIVRALPPCCSPTGYCLPG